MIVRRLPEDSELYHHGIKGQRWYHRRFQNPDGSLTAAGRKRRGLVEQIKYNRRMKKVRKARVEKAKEKQRKAEELNAARQKAQAERKERAEVIKTGDAKQIQKIQSKMTPKEMEQALARVDFNSRLNDYYAKQSEAKSLKNQARLNTIMNVSSTIGNIANNAANVYSALEKVGVVKKKETKSSLDLLKEKKETLELQKSIKDLQKKPSKAEEAHNKEIKRLTQEWEKADLRGKTGKALMDEWKYEQRENNAKKSADFTIDDIMNRLNEELDKRNL